MREGEGSSAGRQRHVKPGQCKDTVCVLQRTGGVLPTWSGSSHGRCLSSGSGCAAGEAHQSGRSDCSQAPGRMVQVCTCKARHPELEQPAVLPGGIPTRLFGRSCTTQLQPAEVIQVRICLSRQLDLKVRLVA